MGSEMCIRDRNEPLYLSQKKWVYDVIATKFLAPAAKSIIARHRKDKDTQKCWQEIEKHYNGSMAAQLSAQKISSYLTSTKLVTLGWRSTNSAFILHWAEQARLLTEISEYPYSDPQYCQFLNNCLAGTPTLCNVLNNFITSQRATGINKPLPFADYIEMLLIAAQTLDAGAPTTNPRFKRSVNNHIFDDDDDEEPQSLEHYSHDVDTPIEQLSVNVNDQRPPQGQRGGRPLRVYLAVSYTHLTLPTICSV